MKVRIFVMSDLHAFDSMFSKKRKPSWFDIAKTDADGDNPIADLKTLIAEKGISADYLFFCGDLADQAYPSATERAWREMHQINGLLGSKALIATAGNHDLDSRHIHNDHDAKGCLLGLKPSFPLTDEHDCNHYWTHHFVVVEPIDIPVRIITINSSAYHGEKKEHERGRISKRTLDRFKAVLKGRTRKSANIVMVHHHPQKLSELKRGDYDDMIGGYDFLQALDPIEYGPWLVLHGHKHFPKITYAQGGGTSPVIFSAGSCAAIPDPDVQDQVGVQVYLITLDLKAGDNSNCYGKFETWDWAGARGWNLSQKRTGLPSSGGFGHRSDIGLLAAGIARKVTAVPQHWDDIVRHHPKVLYMIPSDLDSLIQCLRTKHKCRLELNGDGKPVYVQL